jgi:hypothetical protein
MKHGDEPQLNDKRSGCICSLSNKDKGHLTVSDKQVGGAMLTSIGFLHPHPGIQTLWIPWPGPESRVVSHSLTTLQSTRKMQNHCSGQGKDIIVHNRSAEVEGASQR